ncbi:MAG: diacylglycerol kinase family protein [Candidatus Komeilibacteria bacterium]
MSYLYIYDNFLSEKKYQSSLYKIENRLVDLGIKGKVVRLNVLKNMAEVVEDGIKDGVKTVVVIGDDVSFSKIINVIAKKDVVLGIIPINNKSKFAKIFGIPPAHQACEILAQRIIKEIDLGMVGHYYFIDSATIINEETTVKFGNYNASPSAKQNIVSFNNLNVMSELNIDNKFNPTDGRLELVIQNTDVLLSKNKNTTILPFTKVSVECKQPGAFIVVDRVTKLKPPTTVQVAPNKLKVIVGAQRMF